jgi:hypothetical protein
MSTTNTQSAVGFIGPGERGLPMATAIAVAGYPLHVWARHPGPLSHTPPSAPADRRAPHSVRGGGSGDKPAEQESRRNAARGTLNFSELRACEVRHEFILNTSPLASVAALCNKARLRSPVNEKELGGVWGRPL